MSVRAKIWIEFFLSMGGFGLLWYGSNWMVALGLFMALFGNNLMTSRFLVDLADKISGFKP
jgi:hypothetical protein